MRDKKKRIDKALQMKSFEGKDGKTYLVFHAPDGSYHTFVEVEAKQAARNCGAKEGTPRPNTRKMWDSLWQKN
jgi:hypothetical protein